MVRDVLFSYVRRAKLRWRGKFNCLAVFPEMKRYNCCLCTWNFTGIYEERGELFQIGWAFHLRAERNFVIVSTSRLPLGGGGSRNQSVHRVSIRYIGVRHQVAIDAQPPSEFYQNSRYRWKKKVIFHERNRIKINLSISTILKPRDRSDRKIREWYTARNIVKFDGPLAWLTTHISRKGPARRQNSRARAYATARV